MSFFVTQYCNSLSVTVKRLDHRYPNLRFSDRPNRDGTSAEAHGIDLKVKITSTTLLMYCLAITAYVRLVRVHK